MSRAAVYAATLGPIGYWPIGPGTAASLVVAAIWVVAQPPTTLVVATALVISVLGIPLATRAEVHLGPDDGRIVIDEAAGMMWALVAAPAGLAGAAVALALFRIFDIAKPWPIRRLERVGGGLGVMLDDVVAGLIAAVAAAVVFAWLSSASG